jgi:hypothetical protein
MLRPREGGAALSWVIFIWAIIGALEFFRDGALILVLKPRFSWWLAIGMLIWFEHRRRTRPEAMFSSTTPVNDHI